MCKKLINGERIYFRKAERKDFELMESWELAPENAKFVGTWILEAREKKFIDENYLQIIIVNNVNNKEIGEMIFAYVLEKEIELRRIIIIDEEKNKGYGKEALKLAQKLVFEVFGADKFYLNTREENLKAQHVYKVSGFVNKDSDNINYFMTKENYFNRLFEYFMNEENFKNE